MRLLRFSGPSLFLLAVLSMCTVSALANSTVGMQLTGVGGNQAGGVYTYPYYLSVNKGTPASMMCDTYDNEITIGETWKANAVNLLSGKGLFDGQFMDYKAAALIFKGILDGAIPSTQWSEANFAIWGLFSANARNNPYYGTSGAGALAATYLADAKTAKNWQFNGFTVYVPIPGTQSSGGTAQEFMSYSPSPTPEPGTLTLLGTGMLSLLGIARRKLKKAES